MITVYKYPFGPDVNEKGIQMPQGSKILHVAMQRHQSCIWALVDTNAPLIHRKLKIYGTGHQIEEKEENLYHHGSWLMVNDSYVFHIFEVIE